MEQTALAPAAQYLLEEIGPLLHPEVKVELKTSSEGVAYVSYSIRGDEVAKTEFTTDGLESHMVIGPGSFIHEVAWPDLAGGVKGVAGWVNWYCRAALIRCRMLPDPQDRCPAGVLAAARSLPLASLLPTRCRP